MILIRVCETQTKRKRNANDTKQEEKEEKEEKEINIQFDIFWNVYDKKKGDKDRCRDKWIKLKDEERQKIIDILPDFKKQYKDKQFQPYPETFLNGKRWNDEIEVRKYAQL